MALNETHISYIQNNFTNSVKFKATMFKILPMGWLSGMKVKVLNDERCEVTVPYKRWNKNPFKSTFWAVLGMAAEMSSGAILTMYTYKQKPSIAMLIVNCSGEFHKKATGVTTFICEDSAFIKKTVLEAIESGEPKLVPTTMIGYNSDKEKVATFNFTWSIKARKSR